MHKIAILFYFVAMRMIIIKRDQIIFENKRVLYNWNFILFILYSLLEQYKT